MAEVKIKGAPKKTVSNLCAPYLSSSSTMTAEWNVPNDMIKVSYKYRATKLVAKWTIGMNNTPNSLSNALETSATSDSINLDRFFVENVEYGRSSFYPNTDNKLTAVSVSVKGKNTYKKKGKTKTGDGKYVTQTRQFEVPVEPTIDEISLNTTSGVLSTTIRAGEGNEYQERYDTIYTRTVYTSSNNTSVPTNGNSTSSEISVSYDAVAYKGLTGDNYIKVTWEALNRGYAGDSTSAERHIYLARPKPATIKGEPTVTGDTTGTGNVTVYIDTNDEEEHPVYGVKLLYAKNTDYTDASQLQISDFDESGIEDNGDCTALTMPRSLFEETRGKHQWICVKSYGADESALFSYSEFVEVEKMFKELPSASSATVDIISVESGSDGESAVVTLGWNKNGTDEYTGTEISWSDDKNSWKSTKDPEKYEFTWSDGRYPATGTLQYNDSAKITIMDLSRDTMYYVMARRYLEGDTTTYGAYSSQEDVTPTNAPTSVVARCDPTIAVGEPLGVYWTFGGGGTQTSWRISDGTHNIEEGSSTNGFAQISAEKISQYAVNNSLSFKVYVTTGGGEKDSNQLTVKVISKPTLSVTASDTLTTNALSFTATTSRPCDLSVTVTSQGTSGQTPQGFKAQLAGDTVFSDVFDKNKLTWSNNSTTVHLPVCDFWDKAKYELSVTAIDSQYDLRSESVSKTITVNWARKAINPDSYVTLTPIDDTVDGHLQGVRITLTAPANTQTGDVYDIYRMDGSNANLIGYGFPLTYSEVDEYAPVGGKATAISTETEGYSTMNPSVEGWYELSGNIYVISTDTTVNASKTYYEVDELYYRVAFRTADGDTAYTEKAYAYPYEGIRLDWQGGSLELPYGTSIGDSYKKDVEFRQHMDGSVDGYWNPNIERTGSYSSSIIKLVQPEEINLARQLARYAGPVFVRTDNGSAFTADVQVTDLSVKNEAVTTIAINATEIGITDEFMLVNEEEE